MKKQKKTILLCILALLVVIAILLGLVFAKYTVTWDKEFGLRLVPIGHMDVLTEDLGSKMNSETKHVVFGNSADYAETIASLDSTKTHVGSTSDDLIYMYYDATNYTTYILCEKIISFNADSSNMFSYDGCSNLLSITYDNINTKTVNNMGGMYNGCSGLTELDLTSFDTANVIDMSDMFKDCSGLATVYAKKTYVTDKVTNSENMFTGCYNLVGGEGTRVYLEGSTETTQALDKTNAWIDGRDGKQGYFTDKFDANAYFRSNILKESEQNVTYTVYGKTAWLTIANGLDSKTYAASEVEYTISLYIQKDGEWVLYDKKAKIFAADEYCVERFTITPITSDGTVYDSVKVVAQNLTGLEETIEAVLTFTYESMQVSYKYENGVIYVTVLTNDDSGEYTATITAGITPDNSDPNKIFTNANVGPSTVDIKLKGHTEYEFCFFVTDATVQGQLEADNSLANGFAEFAKK